MRGGKRRGGLTLYIHAQHGGYAGIRAGSLWVVVVRKVVWGVADGGEESVKLTVLRYHPM